MTPAQSPNNNPETPFTPITYWDRPRGKRVVLGRWNAASSPDCFVVLCMQDEVVYQHTQPTTWKEASAIFEEEGYLPGPDRVDSGWNATWARITGRAEEPGKWNGSLAAKVSEVCGIGTWKWVEALRICREYVEKETARRKDGTG